MNKLDQACRPIESDYTSIVDYVRALEDYCDQCESHAEDVIWECIEATGNCAGTGDMIKEHFGL